MSENIPADYKLETSRFFKYHNKYQYRAIVNLPGIEFCRRMNSHNDYDANLSRHTYIGTFLSHIKRDPWVLVRDVLAQRGHLDNVKAYRDWLEHSENSKLQYFKKIYHGSLVVYASDHKCLDELDKFFNKDYIRKTYTLDATKDDSSVIYQVKPTHEYRVHMKSTSYDLKTLLTFVDQYECKLSPSFTYVINSRRQDLSKAPKIYIQSNFFIDVKDEQTITVMTLIIPELVHKVSTIEKR